MTAASWPLPLSDFEFYMFSDDRPSHPMTFTMSVRVDGTLNQADFESAVAEILPRHPLFGARITRQSSRDCVWEPAAFDRPVTSWQSAATAEELETPVPVRRIDITRERGLQIDVRATSDAARVLLTIHHCCCDGIGAIQLIGDLFAAYGRRTATGPKRPQLPELEPGRLRDREQPATSESERRRSRTSLRKSAAKVMRLICRRPMPVRSKHSVRSRDAANDAVAIRSATLDESLRRRLLRHARRLNVSVNDLFIREMMRQVVDWNEREAGLSGNPWVRVTVPVSVRSQRHKTLPAANLVSYAFFTRRRSDCRDPDTLLQSINKQSTGALFGREGLIVLRCIRMLRRIPGLLPLVLSRRSRLGSVVLANVGQIRRRYAGEFPLQSGRWVAGNVIIGAIDGVAPVRPNTAVAVTIGEYAGQMTINLRVDGTVLSDDEARRFLNEYTTRLTDLAHALPDTAPQESDAGSESDADDNQIRPGRLAIPH